MLREADLKKAAEDMKFYKLELINRENTFNNMFGSNPSIGLVNPKGVATQLRKMPSRNSISVSASRKKFF